MEKSWYIDECNPQLTLKRKRRGGRGGEGGGGIHPLPPQGFLSFFLEDKTSVPDVFGSSSFIPRAHFETSLVMVICYGYELCRHK